MKINIRMGIAHILNILPDTCWWDLVMWAMFPEHHDFSEIRDMRGTAGKCKRMGEYNYCGKCDRRYPENSFDVWMEAQRNTADLTPADNLL